MKLYRWKVWLLPSECSSMCHLKCIQFLLFLLFFTKYNNSTHFWAILPITSTIVHHHHCQVMHVLVLKYCPNCFLRLIVLRSSKSRLLNREAWPVKLDSGEPTAREGFVPEAQFDAGTGLRTRAPSTLRPGNQRKQAGFQRLRHLLRPHLRTSGTKRCVRNYFTALFGLTWEFSRKRNWCDVTNSFLV